MIPGYTKISITGPEISILTSDTNLRKLYKTTSTTGTGSVASKNKYKNGGLSV